MKYLVSIILVIFLTSVAFAEEKTFKELENHSEVQLQNSRVKIISMFLAGTKTRTLGKVFYACVDGVKIFNFAPYGYDATSTVVIPGGCDETTQPDPVITEPIVIVKEVVKEVQVKSRSGW